MSWHAQLRFGLDGQAPTNHNTDYGKYHDRHQMKSDVPNTDDEIEVVDEGHEKYGRVRIRERQGAGFSGINKCSIFLTPEQLETVACECLELASRIRSRR